MTRREKELYESAEAEYPGKNYYQKFKIFPIENKTSFICLLRSESLLVAGCLVLSQFEKRTKERQNFIQRRS